jgi:hypothetical protein
MSTAPDGFAEMRAILEALCEERLTASQTARLEELALNDSAARRFYLEYIELHGNLHWDAAQAHLGGEHEIHFTDEAPAPAPEPTPHGPRSHGPRSQGHRSEGPRSEGRRLHGTAAISSESRETPTRRSGLPFVRAVVAGAAIAAALVAAVWAPSLFRRAVHEPSAVAVEPHARTLPQKHAAAGDERRQRSAGAPAAAGDAARPKTSAASTRLSAATVAVHRRPARFQLAVAKKSGQASNAALLPIELNRSPAPSPHRPAELPASSGASDEDRQGPASLIAFVDARIRGGWKIAGIEPSPLATDEEWIRRVYLDVVGHIPPEEAVDAFLKNDGDKNGGEHKRAAVVDRLLRDSGYARNWATVWANLLVGRQPRTPGVRRDELEKFLRDSFAANTPWNETVYALVSAEGTAEQNPAANFLLAHLNQDAVPATALTARLFLGVQVQCTQCHDHPFTKDKQDRFWELNSFFQQTDVVSRAPLSRETASAGSASAGAASMETGPAPMPEIVPEIVTRKVGGPIYYETLRGEMRAAFPVYAGHKIDPGPTVNRRRELARLIAQGDDRQLALAMVNRTWQHFFGHGFTRPVDDMAPHNAPSNPEVLNRLAKEFVASGYDFKQLVRWICATDAYQRASTLDPGNASDDPTTGTAPLFSRVYLKPLAAEQLYDSLLVATRAKSSARTDWNDVGRRREDWVRQFVYSYATEENDEAALPAGSISQALTMMNDRIVEGALAIEPGTLLFDVVHDATDDAAKIRRLSRSALARDPTQAELHAALARLHAARKAARSDKGRDQAAANALADVFWAYLNANEFALVH